MTRSARYGAARGYAGLIVTTQRAQPERPRVVDLTRRMCDG